MCNRYHPSARDSIPDPFRGLPVYGGDYPPSIGPRQPGPYVLRDRIVVGHWGLVPWFAKTLDQRDNRGRPLMTNNCRSETMATKPTFRDAWKNGQRCLVPADLFIEPYWGPWDAPFTKTAWWTFARADGEPWMIAGLWNDWKDPETGEIVPTYTMVTMNADHHPLMSLMHRHDKKLPQDQQDRRCVVPLERSSWDTWLSGSQANALAALSLPPPATFRHGAEDPARHVELQGLP
jgi:putative SOS response-associated peptidase YedK